MTWQLGAFTILAVALAGGFAWYERSRPDARIIALVGTLAAFGALGRIAFAAVPNVKPTTDIVLIAGYALGGAPGFVVGAVAGLTSNFFFGQGPWTPWQMAGWGATGVIGAGLALLIGARRKAANRWLLALACGVVGFAFTAFQDVGDWVTYSDHSLAQLGVYVGKGIGFDLVHAAGCVAFALAFGPSLVRSISRFAARLQVTWRPFERAVAPAIAIVCLAAVAATSPARAGGTPTGYLLSAQNSDGGFGSAPGSSSAQLYSGWAALGLAAEGYNAQSVRRGGQSVIGYITAGQGSDTDPGSLERTILVLRAADLPATNLVAKLDRDIGGDGSVSNQVNLTAFAVLALRAAGVAPPSNMVDWLTRQQDSDGGFNFARRGGSSDLDDTGAALEALASTGGALTSRAVRFIQSHENGDGGFPSQPGGPSNAQSTAWAVQGLLATGVGLQSLGRPISYLRSLIAPDGHVQYSRGDDQTPVWVTAEALMALSGKPLPLAPAPDAGAKRSAPTGHGRAGVSSPKSRASKRGAHHGSRHAPALLHQLAVDLGVADALALAPVG